MVTNVIAYTSEHFSRDGRNRHEKVRNGKAEDTLYIFSWEMLKWDCILPS